MKRGFLIGEIIDDLSELQRDLENRASLGIYDLNKYVEDFFREFFNIVYGLNLLNLNGDRSNEPGIDLGDERKGTAYQITSTRSLEKIKNTLSKINHEQKLRYHNINVFVAGKKQGSYSIQEKDKCGIKFDPKINVMDIQDLMKDIISLDFDNLHNLHSFSRKSTAKVRIELELPNIECEFPTSLKDLIERIPQPKIGTCQKIADFWNARDYGDEISAEEFLAEIEKLSIELSKIPRITREFLTIVIERVLSMKDIDDSGRFYMLLPELERISSRYEYEGDIHILTDRKICDYDEPDYKGGPSSFSFSLPFSNDSLPFAFVEYCKHQNISVHKPLVALDFSDF